MLLNHSRTRTPVSVRVETGCFRTRHRRFLCFISAILLAALGPAADAGFDAAAVRALLSHGNLKSASVGVEIRSITRGETVFTAGARKPLIVASNNKLITTASAFHHLGTEFCFQTALYASGAIEGGLLEGDLVVRGGGDPCLAKRFFPRDPIEPLRRLAAAAARAGVERVKGCLLLDDRIFDREPVAPGWPSDQLNFHYCAPVSGLALLENVLEVEVSPASAPGAAARLRVVPESSFFRFLGTIETTGKRKENLIFIDRPDEEACLRVNGKTWSGNEPRTYTVAMREPVVCFGAYFLEALRAEGIEVDGGLKRAEEKIDYESGAYRCLETVASPLTDAVMITNKESHNHFAEQLYKMAGWKVEGQGTFESGAKAAQRLFQDLGLDEIDPFTMKDGSGLSRENTFSAHTLVMLLDAVYRTSFRDEFIRSLPVAGLDGSLEKRLVEEPYRLRVRGKTGWIREVSALSGYVQALSGEVFAFAVLINGYQGLNATMKEIQDDICRVIVKSGT